MTMTPSPPNAMPVGAIIPYAGDASKQSTYHLLDAAGWMACDGSPCEVEGLYKDLYDVIGICHGGKTIGTKVVHFNLPDLTSLYVRGVDGTAGRDPDAPERSAHAPGGCSGNEVGSFQGYATAAPHAPFVTNNAGAHTHSVQPVTTDNHYAYDSCNTDMSHRNDESDERIHVRIDAAGAHSHDIYGGDSETRPLSICLSWIIRYAATPAPTPGTSADQAPIGTVIAFGGLMTTARAALHAAGWLPCDGQSYSSAAGTEFAALFGVIGVMHGGGSGWFNVPDLRGRFARGVDGTAARDPDAAARNAAAPGGNTGNAVGSVQQWATGLPLTPLVAKVSPDHVHAVQHLPNTEMSNAVATSSGHIICAWNGDAVTTSEDGNHTHTLSTGGDHETRPDNLNLHWFIKYKNT